MDSNDITPQFALTKINSLLESRRYEECNKFIARLNNFTVKSILTDLPISQLHLTIPNSLSVLDCIYNKVYGTSTSNFPIQYLRTDELLKNMVILFSQPTNSNNRDKNCNLFYPYCRNILRIVASVEPEFLQMVKERRNLLSQSLKFLGQHGMVKSGIKTTGIKMISLHDALKIEFDRVISLYKSALHKLEEFSLSGKNPSESSVNTGPAPSEASHQRLLQVTRDDVQDRLIKNKTIYNVVERVFTGQAVDNLIDILEKRIEYDKQILFQESELRKLYGFDKSNYVSLTIRQYLHGYNVLVQLIQEGCGLETTTSVDDDGTDSDNLSLGSKRPTELIRLYGNLYTDGRLDALDALDDLKDLEELSILKTKILFSIIVVFFFHLIFQLTFRSTEELLETTKSKLRELLNIPNDVTESDKLSLDIQKHLDHYLQQTFDRFELDSHVKNVCEQIYETLFDYPCLKQCEGLVQFVEECLQISLGLVAQNPSYIICYTDTVFQRDRHIRFHTSDPGTDKIKNFIWPCLLEGEEGICVSKGFVIT
ncbi:hypothetical protein LOTGIDRAFT_189026 [Lottia gigantea]|uniref:Mitochondria-eating protein n=1 Tax=Lottia gigantea TaxID=225164 RepID=V4ANF9_LOTGI|nr:hypothetical protein LOTGIDRAFT_189026 [Lottia gigantea]ESO95156.1 hypothetical protein LOTGIDRAFT_189026 [Lottia gigantea]